MEHSIRYDYVELPPAAQIGLHSLESFAGAVSMDRECRAR